MPVYKYLKKQHLAQFREKGTIRIGNIELYKDIVNAPIRDPDEGRLTYLIQTGHEPLDLTQEEANAITNEYLIKATLRVAPNSYFRSELKVPNAFVFSTSRILNKKLFKKWDCDAYYKIIDPKQFMKIIYDELTKRIPLKGYLARKVIYVKTKKFIITNSNKSEIIRKVINDQSNLSAAKVIHMEDYFTKTEAFKDEQEYRGVFIPAVPIGRAPIYLNCKKLLSCSKF